VSRPMHLLGVDGKKCELVLVSDARISGSEDIQVPWPRGAARDDDRT
jgi:hypothetical protein